MPCNAQFAEVTAVDTMYNGYVFKAPIPIFFKKQQPHFKVTFVGAVVESKLIAEFLERNSRVELHVMRFLLTDPSHC